MSKSLNQELRSWKDLEFQIRGTQCYRAGIPLSKRDSATYCDAVLLQAMMTTDLLSSSTPNRTSRIKRWLFTTLHSDVLLVSDLIKRLTTDARNYDGRNTSYHAFKQHYRSDYPIIGDFVSPIKEEVEEYLSSPSAATFTIINQFLVFMSRISLRDVDLDADALARYLATEKRLADSTYNSHILTILNKIMREWLSDYREEVLTPSHGNGSVAFMHSKPSLLEKYQNMNSDIRLDYWLNPHGGVSSFSPLPVRDGLKRLCQVQCVPKSISTKRVISMEPVSLQYFQHAVFNNIDDYIADHPVLRNRIHLHDSDYNVRLAKIGSTDGSYATIDLSDASDSVSWDLVKAVFARTNLLRSLYCTKSDRALLPNSEEVSLRKFAPMGSALCFPIECLIFAVICEYALRYSGRHYSKGEIPYVVYGDDIVIKTELADHVISLLHDCNFIVNTEKTFTSKTLKFRESCGGEFFAGVDVSPVRLSRKFTNNRPCQRHPELFPHYIRMANSLLSKGMRMTRLWFVHNLVCLPIYYRPPFGVGEDEINTTSASNYHLIHKYNDDWQADTMRIGHVCALFPRVSEVHEEVRLFEFLRVTSRRTSGPSDPGDVVEVQLSRPRLRLKSRFVSNS